jgi:hypothetical protein
VQESGTRKESSHWTLGSGDRESRYALTFYDLLAVVTVKYFRPLDCCDNGEKRTNAAVVVP